MRRRLICFQCLYSFVFLAGQIIRFPKLWLSFVLLKKHHIYILTTCTWIREIPSTHMHKLLQLKWKTYTRKHSCPIQNQAGTSLPFLRENSDQFGTYSWTLLFVFLILKLAWIADNHVLSNLSIKADGNCTLLSSFLNKGWVSSNCQESSCSVSPLLFFSSGFFNPLLFLGLKDRKYVTKVKDKRWWSLLLLLVYPWLSLKLQWVYI